MNEEAEAQPEMTTILHSIEINVPPEAIFSYLVDGENAPAWHPSVISAKRVAGGAQTSDSVMRYLAKVGPLRFNWATAVVEFEPNRKFVDIQKEGPFRHYRATGLVSPTSQGSCVELTIEYELPYGPLGKVLDALFVRASVSRHTELALKNLKRILGRKKVAAS